ncbi:MAG: 4-hydroxy-3-methylbut-2-enyl diphosphate reductase [Clostridioides sp.]|jgi:4-hydroxy-3-methylbut-2-enyl diphosphate reductase|nr:4-hydroxy-3-methylbut-2-enyl diphosphate reductase [Clostridioides sp.]
MEVRISDNAGFCFGVKRAMKMAWNEVNEKENVYSLGPLIHNTQVVSKYEGMGLNTVNELESVPTGTHMIIRSHGVGESVYKESEQKNLDVIDTTCPFVKKIHNIVKEYKSRGYKIIVIGDKDHPEVIGINGWCGDSATIINTISELRDLDLDKSKNYCVVAQTTLNSSLYNEITEELKNMGVDIILNDTICSATKERQESAKRLANEVDCMVVIGGRHSSNTQKLVKVCEGFVPTFAIETSAELDDEKLSEFSIVGVTAGASTPDWIIEEVIKHLENI